MVHKVFVRSYQEIHGLLQGGTMILLPIIQPGQDFLLHGILNLLTGLALALAKSLALEVKMFYYRLPLILYEPL